MKELFVATNAMSSEEMSEEIGSVFEMVFNLLRIYGIRIWKGTFSIQRLEVHQATSAETNNF